MESRIKKAVECFDKGFNCSQAVFSVYAPVYGVDEKTALKIGCGFGAGMGVMQKTCGAVTGAFMALGLKYGKFREDDTESKDQTYAAVREFSEKFMAIHGSINCRDLLSIDITTPEGMEAAREQGLFDIKCGVFVKDAAAILEDML